MKNLRLALVALVAMGIFGGMDAYRGGCRKNKCNKVEKAEAVKCSAPACTERREEFVEKCEKIECRMVPERRTVYYEKPCTKIYTTCTTEKECCKKGCFEPVSYGAWESDCSKE
jgi:CRISPR/Cas system CMR-associated protein Cmr1 (group 7 of RAMP superfamily)